MKPIIPILALCLSACNRTLPEGTCETPADCSSGICDGEACVVAQSVSCVDAAPEGASSELVDVEIAFTEADGWGTPADCAWSCDADYAQEDAACVHTKTASCTDAAPTNGSSVVADVEITYTDAGGWTAPAECAWSCDADFVDEGGACIQSKQVACTDAAPTNGSSVVADTEITYTDAGGWTAPAECAWSCDADFVDEGGACIQTKVVTCADAAPTNGSSVVADVEIAYTTAGGWAAPAECVWSCNADFADEGGACIQDKLVPCADVAPTDGTSVVADVEVTYTDAGGWTAPAECPWSCDTDFVEELGACYLGVTALVPGDLVLTEVHADPAFDPAGLACTDAKGEYVEIYNNTSLDIALKGLTIEDGGAAPTAHPGGVVLAAGGYAVIGRSADCNGVGLDGTFDFGLNNTGDLVTIGNGVQVLDTVDFTQWSKTSLTGVSFSLSPDLIDADLNDDPAAWCASSAPIPNGLVAGVGDLGSPGVQNPTCDRAGTSSIDAAFSCKDIFDGGFSTGDGLYWLDLTGWTGEDAFQGSCDMTNGGWTQVVRILGSSVAHAGQTGALNSWADPTKVAKLSDADINALNTVGYWRYHCGTGYDAYVKNVENTWTSAKVNPLQWSIDRGLDLVYECGGDRAGYVFSDFATCPVGHTDYAAAGGAPEGYGCYVVGEGWNRDGSLWAK